MVKLSLEDEIINKAEVQNAESAFDVFRLLDTANKISANDITLIIAMLEMLGAGSDDVKKIIKKYGFEYVDVDYTTKFTDYRIQIVTIGQHLTTEKLTHLADTLRIPVKYSSNRWVLLQYLQTTPCFIGGRVLNAETLPELTKTPGGFIDPYQLMLTAISTELLRSQINLDMVKFCLEDEIINKAEAQNAESAFDVFRLLDNAGKISANDITLIIAMLEMLGAASDGVKKIIEKYGFEYVDVDYTTKFSPYRIQIVTIGQQQLLADKRTKIVNTLRVPIRLVEIGEK